ncbi:MAG: hypothetical protein U1E29_04045 [Coriobacteriia bacterium]|nr:hypothetical protein [Coriobacteriia bacterium]
MMVRRLVFALMVAVLAAGLAACAAEPARLDPPAQVIQSLLELRAQRSTEASAYAEYVAGENVARELAQAAVEETTGVTPTPDWESPYVSEQTSATADVVVVWKEPQDWADWPTATIFKLSLLDDGRWVAVDAAGVNEGEEVPSPR